MSEVTRILSQIENGDSEAADALLPLVYDELRQLAAAKLDNEKPGQTLQATALVHDAYLRLVGSRDAVRWNGSGHFFGAAAEAMRRILIDRARAKKRLKRGGETHERIELDDIQLALDTPPADLLALDEALERLALEYPESAKLVELRFFTGLKMREAADALEMPRRTADRHWAFARAWLHQQLRASLADDC